MNDGAATSVTDIADRCILYRAATGRYAPAINRLLLEARKHRRPLDPYTSTGYRGSQGSFQQYEYMLHHGSVQNPQMSVGYTNNQAMVDRILEILTPVCNIVNAIFTWIFPRLYAQYVHVNEQIQKRHPCLRPLFYPFCSFCINMEGIQYKLHEDCKNFATGMCYVIPFGDLDYKKEGQLIIKELNMEFEVAPGVPIFFPSALFHHYNSQLIGLGIRGSFVAWTSGSLMQWVDLEGRALDQLTKAEVKDYKCCVKDRIQEGLNLLI
ncbi:hypothetical protein PUNSTDRAFT_138109 [Punctularia strigosozonata HHB-11173 SS5]|uniref:JmjC domain-containing protein n=1 Tax=Punctularia strigosozonata (strain HHB-11173) TaxID=741275 RepID=R7S4V4_PUNST|nr:uncharacterized protein PUNSTDRAFT_138109 [Punctularia strigosozonata HHB-11173 SS5]EIN04919.1 hypothetical protein PUNSTDRAFT_138109 [Punctularia strigosozonata HHB-11173 SS5]